MTETPSGQMLVDTSVGRLAGHGVATGLQVVQNRGVCEVQSGEVCLEKQISRRGLVPMFQREGRKEGREEGEGPRGRRVGGLQTHSCHCTAWWVRPAEVPSWSTANEHFQARQSSPASPPPSQHFPAEPRMKSRVPGSQQWANSRATRPQPPPSSHVFPVGLHERPG